MEAQLDFHIKNQVKLKLNSKGLKLELTQHLLNGKVKRTIIQERKDGLDLCQQDSQEVFIIDEKSKKIKYDQNYFYFHYL